ncbi:MAG: GldG family protein [Terricaulis sp.]
MTGRRFAFIAALAFLVMFVGANVVAGVWFRGWRLDLTENRLYSISDGTQNTLDHLSEPVEFKFYYSRDAATRVPELQTYAARVREMLETYAARSHGRVHFTEVNVKPFTDQEDEAEEAGIQPVRPYQGADPIYFGLTGANAIDDKRTIPYFDPQREPFLEYEVTRLIFELEHPDRTKVALITSLPLNPPSGDMQQAQPGGSTFATEMGALLDVTKLDPNFTAIPADTDVLAIIHPPVLTAAQSYAIDQFILRKGRAFIALDPASMLAQQAAQQQSQLMQAPAPTSSTLEPLLQAWGVSLSPDVVLDLNGALPVNAQDPATGQTVQLPQPLFFSVPRTQLSQTDLMTAALRRGINFGLSGAFNVSERPGVTAEVLAKTGERTMHMPADQALARPSPYDVLRAFPPIGRVETIAVRLSGNLVSAFPNGPPPDAPVAPVGVQRLTRSAAPAQIVLVADTDFLADDFYINPQDGTAAADNASFALNAIDVLGGSNALVSLRSRAPSVRKMEVIDHMEADAQGQIQRRQDELQADLQDTETQLQQLQAHGHGSGYFSGNLGAELTPQESAAIERFRKHVVEVRSELRHLARDLRGDITRLQTLVVFINVWLAPLIIALAGLILFWRRQRRAQGARR